MEWTIQENGTDDIRSFDEALNAIALGDEGDEIALFWSWDSLIDASGDDGPHAMQTIPPRLEGGRVDYQARSKACDGYPPGNGTLPL
ncbi:hypothetical protein MASR2M48_22900 [Spirochaetota bacterium]